jgi:polysaccharide export outer membrane protein
MTHRLRAFLTNLAIGVLLVACASQGAGLPLLESAPGGEANYHLGPGDKLDVKVLGAENLSGQYNVADNGTISTPLIGEVKAAGLTRAQLEQELAQKLADGFVQNPKISVTILEYRPFYVYGEVTKPGKYDYAAGMRVLSAVSVAGGFTPRANTDYVVISRDGQDRKAVGMTPILPDDIIKVPERYF